MRQIMIYGLAIFIYSCSAGSEITIHPDNSATVLQHYLESPTNPEYKQDSLGYKDTAEERKKYNSPIISDFEDFYGAWFTFEISMVDSLPKYLSRIPEDYVKINTFGDSLFVFRVEPLSEKPKKLIDYSFQFSFENSIKNVSSSKGSRVLWEPKKKPNSVVIGLNHDKIWREQKGILVTVEINKNAR